jgi:hypothetical protein
MRLDLFVHGSGTEAMLDGVGTDGCRFCQPDQDAAHVLARWSLQPRLYRFSDTRIQEAR